MKVRTKRRMFLSGGRNGGDLEMSDILNFLMFAGLVAILLH